MRVSTDAQDLARQEAIATSARAWQVGPTRQGDRGLDGYSFETRAQFFQCREANQHKSSMRRCALPRACSICTASQPWILQAEPQVCCVGSWPCEFARKSWSNSERYMCSSNRFMCLTNIRSEARRPDLTVSARLHVMWKNFRFLIVFDVILVFLMFWKGFGFFPIFIILFQIVVFLIIYFIKNKYNSD